MAKCIINIKTNEVDRVSNQEAKRAVKTGNWKYISKDEHYRRSNEGSN